MIETYALKNPRIIRKELVSRPRKLAKDGFRYTAENDGFRHQKTSERGKDSRGGRMDSHLDVPVKRRQ